MPFDIAVNNIVEVKIVCSCGDQTSVNVRHYVCDAVVGDGASDATFAAALDFAFADVYSDVMSGQARYRGVSVQLIRPTRRPAQVSVVNANDGTAIADAAPKMAAGVISFQSEFASRKGRGRLYAPFPAESMNDSLGNPNAGYLTALDALAQELILGRTVGGGGNTSQMTPTIYHRSTFLHDRIVSYLVRSKWGTQRRRSAIAGGDTNPF